MTTLPLVQQSSKIESLPVVKERVCFYQLDLLLKAHSKLCTSDCILSSSRFHSSSCRGLTNKNSSTLSSSVFVRSSHNESERDRRAHLRKCIDDVKKVLCLQSSSTISFSIHNFSNNQNCINNNNSSSNNNNSNNTSSNNNGSNSNRSRITTLAILKEASKQIQFKRLKNSKIRSQQEKLEMEWKHLNEKNNQLHKEINLIKKKLRRGRCSGSECSVATTISDDNDISNTQQISMSTKQFQLNQSELLGIPRNVLKSMNYCPEVNFAICDETTTVLTPSAILLSPPSSTLLSSSSSPSSS